MKTSLKFLTLVLAASLPCAAFAEMLGSHIPSTLGAENMIGLFAIVSIALMLVSDYSRRTRIKALACVTPADVAARKSASEAHRLAA